MDNQGLKEFYDHYHSNHLKFAINGFPFRKAYWDNRIASFLPPSKESAFLDLGCGNGDFLLYLKIAGYQHITGVEYSGEMKAITEKTVEGIRIVESEAGEFLRSSNEKCILNPYSN